MLSAIKPNKNAASSPSKLTNAAKHSHLQQAQQQHLMTTRCATIINEPLSNPL